MKKLHVKFISTSRWEHLSNVIMIACHHFGQRKIHSIQSPFIPPLSPSLSVCPCASAVIPPSFGFLPGVPCFFASPLHRSPSLPLFPSAARYPLTTSVSITLLLPLLDSIPPPSPPCVLFNHFLSFCMSPCIMACLICLS